MLKGLGIAAGDRVALYMPMIPELPIAMLACARIGAAHSVVFGGFSATALVERINDCQCKLVVTADGGYRRGNVVELKKAVDEALPRCPTVQNVVVVRRVKTEIHMQQGRDHWWHEVMVNTSPRCDALPVDAEHLLYILYTSGSTGKPKGIFHTTGGYMVHSYLTSKLVFDLRDEDIYWCTADIGWVTGHTYVTYGPLLNGATQVMYEGAPNCPSQIVFWEHHRKIRREHSLHGADRDPRVYQVGRTVAAQTRPHFAALAGQRRRADQSRSVDVVSPKVDRTGTLPDCRRYLLVAN